MNDLYEQAKVYYRSGLKAFANASQAEEPIERDNYLRQAISFFELSLQNGYKQAEAAIHRMKNLLRDANG